MYYGIASSDSTTHSTESDVKSNKPFGQASHDRVQPRLNDPTLLRVRPAMIVAKKIATPELALYRATNIGGMSIGIDRTI